MMLGGMPQSENLKNLLACEQIQMRSEHWLSSPIPAETYQPDDPEDDSTRMASAGRYFAKQSDAESFARSLWLKSGRRMWDTASLPSSLMFS